MLEGCVVFLHDVYIPPDETTHLTWVDTLVKHIFEHFTGNVDDLEYYFVVAGLCLNNSNMNDRINSNERHQLGLVLEAYSKRCDRVYLLKLLESILGPGRADEWLEALVPNLMAENTPDPKVWWKQRFNLIFG